MASGTSLTISMSLKSMRPWYRTQKPMSCSTGEQCPGCSSPLLVAEYLEMCFENLSFQESLIFSSFPCLRKSSEEAVRERQKVVSLASMKEHSLLQFYISREWLNKFNTFAEPGPITNHTFLCSHGGKAVLLDLGIATLSYTFMLQQQSSSCSPDRVYAAVGSASLAETPARSGSDETITPLSCWSEARRDVYCWETTVFSSPFVFKNKPVESR